MTWRSSILVSLVIVTITAASTKADPPSASQEFTPDNAAYWYQKADAELQALSSDDLDALYEYLESPAAEPPTREVLDALERSREAINFLQKGAQRGTCDYQLDYSQGIDLLVPNIGQLRKAARVLSADARVQISNGNSRDAVDRLTAGYQMANHLSNDSLVISSLVSISVFMDIDRHTQAALGKAIFSPTECDQLLEVTQRLRTRDFNIPESLATEQVMMSQWVVNEFEDPGASEISFSDFGIDPLTLTSESLANDLRSYDQAMDELMVIFREDDPIERERKLSEWSDFVNGGGHGQLAPILAGVLAGVIKSVTTANQQLDDRIGTLHAIATGQVRAEEKVNAALVYKLAFEAFDKVPIQHKQALTTLDPGARYPADHSLPFEQLDSALALFSRAAAFRECDFSILLKEPIAPFGPWYAATMRDGIRAMLLRASHALTSGDTNQAITDLQSAYSMIHHLSDDHRLLSALVAQQSTREANRILARLMAEDHEEQSVIKLRSTVTGLPKSDPYGYIAGLHADRSNIQYWTAPQGQMSPELSGTHVLRFMALLDTLARAGTENETTQWTHVDSMPRVIDLVALEQIRQHTAQLAMLLRDRETQMIIDADLPAIADVRQRQQSSRSDLRQALSILQRRTISTEATEAASE